jgi:hypothetical protein
MDWQVLVRVVVLMCRIRMGLNCVKFDPFIFTVGINIQYLVTNPGSGQVPIKMEDLF